MDETASLFSDIPEKDIADFFLHVLITIIFRPYSIWKRNIEIKRFLTKSCQEPNLYPS